MLLVGLTGGIGSGKSSVAALLARHGAVVLDADDLARDAVAPGTEGERAVLARFPTAAAPGGRVDREALARIVFADAAARADLEAIVHPEVRRLLAEACAPLADTDAVVVFAAPLLVETGSAAGFDLLVVVTAPQAERLARLAARRGMPEAEARARMAAQASDAARLAAADLVVDNGGSVADLEARVAGLWTELRRRARP